MSHLGVVLSELMQLKQRRLACMCCGGAAPPTKKMNSIFSKLFKKIKNVKISSPYSSTVDRIIQNIQKKTKKRIMRSIPISSVAGGGGGGKWGTTSPHWPEEYAKHHVFSTFEADFCFKYKNSPPKNDSI